MVMVIRFMETARKTMIKRGWLNSENKRLSVENYNQLHIIVENDCKKKEVIAWGKNQILIETKEKK
jgi:hypothetical protein